MHIRVNWSITSPGLTLKVRLITLPTQGTTKQTVSAVARCLKGISVDDGDGDGAGDGLVHPAGPVPR